MQHICNYETFSKRNAVNLLHYHNPKVTSRFWSDDIIMQEVKDLKLWPRRCTWLGTSTQLGYGKNISHHLHQPDCWHKADLFNGFMLKVTNFDPTLLMPNSYLTLPQQKSIFNSFWLTEMEWFSVWSSPLLNSNSKYDCDDQVSINHLTIQC